MREEPIAVPEPLHELILTYRGHCGGIKQKSVLEGVQILSEMFNGIRPHVPGYLSKKNLRQAYIIYFLAINYAKVRLVLRELKSFGVLRPNPRVLDFGSGPGTASLAALDELDAPELTLVDVVTEALDDAAFLLETYKGAKSRRLHEVPSSRFDVIIAANVLSELRDAAALRGLLDESLEPGGYFVLVEPALEKTTRAVMAWRDELHAAGYKIAAPCIDVAVCPLRTNTGLWCHQARPWKLPGFIDSVDRKLGFDKESLKYSYLIVTKDARTRADSAPGTWRVVSSRHRSKGKMWSWLCGPGGLVAAEMLTRYRSEVTADFEHAQRGDVLSIKPAPKGRLAPEAEIKRIT